MHVLLIQPPFLSTARPSLGLTNLATTLRAAGHVADIDYANLRFADVIGHDNYTLIADRLPVQLLAGDLAFAGALNDADLPDPFRVRAMVDHTFGTLLDAKGRERIINAIFEAAAEAPAFAAGFAEPAVAAYDLVGISAIFQIAPALAVARAIKRGPAAPLVVLGGSHCEGPMGAAVHERFAFLDFVGRGEGERLIVDLVDALEDGETVLDTVPGLLWRSDDGSSVANGERGTAPDLDSIPVPTYADWIDQRRRHMRFDMTSVMLPVETSRGCWYGARSQCVFCGLNGNNIAFRSKSPNIAVRDIAHVGSYGAGSVNATDNIIDSTYFDTVLTALSGRTEGYNIFYEVKSNLSTKQIRRLADAGVRTVQPGVESLSTPVLRRMRKGVTGVQNVRMLRTAAEHRVGITWNLLYGFAGDTLADYEEMARVIGLIPHLYPPVFESNRIRADRFSPMFNEPEQFGIGKLRPVPGYAHVFEASDSERDRRFLNDVAYYFDYETDAIQEETHRTIASLLASAVGAWHAAYGQAVLGSVLAGAQTVVIDRRPDREQPPVALSDAESDLLSILADGPTEAQLAKRATGLFAPGGWRTALGNMIDNGWVVVMDARFLSLVVPLTQYVPPSVPAPLMPTMAAELYMAATREYWAEVAEVQSAVRTQPSRSN